MSLDNLVFRSTNSVFIYMYKCLGILFLLKPSCNISVYYQYLKMTDTECARHVA